MAEVRIKATHMIKPSEKTWTGTMKLSEFDMMVAKAFVPTLYLYKPNKEWNPTSISETLMDSLRKVLVHFYPLAGRLKPLGGGRYELELDEATCGVQVVEAETLVEMEELGDLAEAEDRGRLQHLFPMVDYRKPIEEMPLVILQIMHFRCGAVGVCITATHALLDGYSASHFFTEWTRLARGETLGMTPLYDSSLLRAGEEPKSDWIIKKQLQSPLPSSHPSNQASLPQIAGLTLPVSKSEIANLKKSAGNDPNGRPYSTFVVVTSHAWRCASKARGHQGTKLNAVGIAVDVRKRLNPPLPREFNGNGVVITTATCESDELNTSTLGFACARIKETIDKVNGELVWDFVDYLKGLEDLGEWRGLMTPEGDFVNPDILMSSWQNMSLNDLDFGWGGVERLASTPPPWEGMACLRAGSEEGSATVVICLQAVHADKFKDYFFQQLH